MSVPGPNGNDIGRPSLIDAIVLKKLEEAFAIGCTDTEACLYAGISTKILYNYQESHPEFKERKDMLKEKPVLKARTTVVSNLDKEDTAKWYLERKKKNEFAQRQEMTGSEGERIEVEIKDSDIK